MEQKYKLTFTENNIQDSVAYVLVSKFNIEPSILKAEIEDDGGMLILKLKGDESRIKAGIKYLSDAGIGINVLDKHITRDPDKCIDCGSCVSICPTKSFTFDPKTWEVHLNYESCIACGSCLSSCPTHAVTLTL